MARSITIPHPPIVSRDQWLTGRKKFLAHEKDLTRHRDRINAERRQLPMVKIEKDYVFDGPNGRQNLEALFDGRRQLIVYHEEHGLSVFFRLDNDIYHTYSAYARHRIAHRRLQPPRHNALWAAAGL
jgi:predicted dithiol-disulfide oxidoreductase (DUF899 family)